MTLVLSPAEAKDLPRIADLEVRFDGIALLMEQEF
jgi:hypothetical protein